MRLARALPDVPLLLTGADRRGEIPPVAWGYAQAARELGIAPARLQVLDTPVDTAQEARAVRAALAGTGAACPRLVLVTSAAHLPRAMLQFQAVGLDPRPRAHPAPGGSRQRPAPERLAAFRRQSAQDRVRPARVPGAAGLALGSSAIGGFRS